MNVVIRSQHVPLSSALVQHCRARIWRAMQPFTGHVTRVEMVLLDENGPKKGPAHVCRAFLELASGERVMFESSTRDFYQAATRTAAGAGRRLARVLDRTRTHAQGRRVEPLDAA